MTAYKITIWVDTDLDRGEVSDRIEQIDLDGIQYQIDEVTSA